MRIEALPQGACAALFARAMVLLDDVERQCDTGAPFWTIGGGTVLMLRYAHRQSKDIDIFLSDPQYLGFFTPRLSDTAASLTQDYAEDQGASVKLLFDEGEIDFVAAPNLLPDGWELWQVDGRQVRIETAAEIIAKKMFHRGNRATARDLFDLARVIEHDPEQLATAAPFLLRHRDLFLKQIRRPGPGLTEAFAAIDATGYRPSFEHCVSLACAFLERLPPQPNS